MMQQRTDLAKLILRSIPDEQLADLEDYILALLGNPPDPATLPPQGDVIILWDVQVQSGGEA